MPLDGCWEGLDEAGLHVVGTWGLAIGLVQRGPQVLHGVLLDLGSGPLRDPRSTWRPRSAWKPGRSTGRLSYISRQKARTANITSWASVTSVWVRGPARFSGPTGPGPLPLWPLARLSTAGQFAGPGKARNL